MSQNLDIVKKTYAAWESKDFESLRKLLHEKYRGIGPGINMNGIADAEKMIESMPMEGRAENETYIEDGNKVVRLWDWVATSPKEFRARMAELNIVEDGKVIWNECFFDSAAFPKEMQEDMKQAS